MSDRIARRVAAVPPSGIRKFFDIAATMHDVISLGIGEPDFVTPDVIRAAGMASLQRGETRYTSNSGILELRQALTAKWEALYGIGYNPDTETLITVGGSEALYLALTAILTALVVFDGESTWLEGLMLLGLYLIIAASVWYGPVITA